MGEALFQFNETVVIICATSRLLNLRYVAMLRVRTPNEIRPGNSPKARVNFVPIATVNGDPASERTLTCYFEHHIEGQFPLYRKVKVLGVTESPVGIQECW